MYELITTDTKEWAYSVFSRMSEEELSKELEIIILARKLYLDNFLADSFIYAYIDDIYEIIRDVLVDKMLLGKCSNEYMGM